MLTLSQYMNMTPQEFVSSIGLINFTIIGIDLYIVSLIIMFFCTKNIDNKKDKAGYRALWTMLFFLCFSVWNFTIPVSIIIGISVFLGWLLCKSYSGLHAIWMKLDN